MHRRSERTKTPRLRRDRRHPPGAVRPRRFTCGMDAELATAPRPTRASPHVRANRAQRPSSRRVSSGGRLVVLHRSVFLVGGVPLNDGVWLHAATMATGGVASHRSAAHLLGLVDAGPSRPEVTIDPCGNNRGPFITHRSGDLLSRDTTTVNGVPTTNATRTLVDLGSVVRSDMLEDSVGESAFEEDHHYGSARASLLRTRHAGSPGHRRVAFIARRRATRRWRRPRVTSRRCSARILRDGGLPAPCVSTTLRSTATSSASMRHIPT